MVICSVYCQYHTCCIHPLWDERVVPWCCWAAPLNLQSHRRSHSLSRWSTPNPQTHQSLQIHNKHVVYTFIESRIVYSCLSLKRNLQLLLDDKQDHYWNYNFMIQCTGSNRLFHSDHTQCLLNVSDSKHQSRCPSSNLMLSDKPLAYLATKPTQIVF